MSLIQRAQLKPDDASNVAAGLQMRPQRHQQPHWGRFRGGPLHLPTADTPICWALSLLQHLDKIGMETSLTPTPLSETPPMTHSITENFDDITTEQQGLLAAKGIENIEEDLAAPRSRRWTPLSYLYHTQRQPTDDIPTTRQRPTNAPMPRSHIQPKKILLQIMGNGWIITSLITVTSQRRRVIKHSPTQRLRYPQQH